MPKHDRKLGLWLIGAAGNVAATAAVGVAALTRRLVPPLGLITESKGFPRLPLVPISRIVLGGHEISGRTIYQTAEELFKQSGLFGEELLRKVKPVLGSWQRNLRPGTTLGCDARIQRLARGRSARRTGSGRAVIRALRKDLRMFTRRHRLDRVVVVNVASTEGPWRLGKVHRSWAGLEKSLGKAGRPPLPASSLYALAAIEEGMPFINFTPSTGANVPAIRELAEASGTAIMGADGKTGETLLKSVIAPLFRHRHLEVLSWSGHNILGNRDGWVLQRNSNKSAKLLAKDGVLASILGYQPEAKTSIEYLAGLHDWKTAWDHIAFRGFLGVKMRLQFIWEGCDSILAAPLVIDLARLADLFAHEGGKGVMRHLACFFKAPMDVKEAALSAQVSMLKQHLAERYPKRRRM